MSRPLTSNVLFQSYIALGLEPGTAWEEVRLRHKDLIMAWHPDRFADDKQKNKAEEELKKINAARDVLRRHFQKEHSSSSTCPCRARTDSEPAAKQRETGSYNQQAPQTPPPAQTQTASMQPTALLKSQTAATVALIILSLLSIAAYHKLATAGRTPLRDIRTESPYPQSESRPAAPASDQPLPPGANNSAEQTESASTPAEKSNVSEPELPDSSGQTRAHAIPGTFYAHFTAAQEQREQQRFDARQHELTKRLSRTQAALAATGNQITELERKLPLLDQEMEEHQSLINEILQVNNDLETTQAANQDLTTMNLYMTNPGFKKHADALRDLAAQKQSLQMYILRLQQQMEQGQATMVQLKGELAQLTGR